MLLHTSLAIVSLLMKLSSVLRSSHSASCWCRWVFDINYKDKEKEMSLILHHTINILLLSFFSVLPTQVFIHCILLTLSMILLFS